MLGSAIGFLVTDCISCPDIPSAAPARIPNTVRGILASTILTSIFGAALFTNAPIMLLIPTSLTPHITDNAMQMNNSKNIAIYAKTILFLSINLTTSF